MSGIAPIGSYGQSIYIQPMNYHVKNQSKVSDAYTESVKRNGGTDSARRVGAAYPVQYANAQAISSEQKVEYGKDIAFSFGEQVTGYARNGSADTYSAVGSLFDAYA